MECGVKPTNRPSSIRTTKKWKHAVLRRRRILRPVEALEDRRLLASDFAPSTVTGTDVEDFETGDFSKFPWHY